MLLKAKKPTCDLKNLLTLIFENNNILHIILVVYGHLNIIN